MSYHQVELLKEGSEPLLRCNMCGIHILMGRLIKHLRMACYYKNMEMRLSWKYVEVTSRYKYMEFNLTDKEGYKMI